MGATLSSVVGQDAAVAAVRAALGRDALPQVYLLVGPDGVGKSTLALALARTLICKNPVKDVSGAVIDACDVCSNCRQVAEGTHPEVFRIAPDGDFTRMWQLWSRPGHPTGPLETLPFAPIAGSRRIFLFERAETFNDESANSLLKALEEPPVYVQFLLCAPSPGAVLPTILSRCQMLRLTASPTATITSALTARGIAPDEAKILAAYAEGAFGRALRLAEQPELREQRDALLTLAAKIASSPPIAAFRLAEELRNVSKPAKAKKGDEEEERSTRGDLARAMDVLAAWYGDLLALAVRGPDAPVVHADRRDALNAAQSRYRPEQLAQNIAQVHTSRRHVLRNANAQLLTEVLMAKLVPHPAA